MTSKHLAMRNQELDQRRIIKFSPSPESSSYELPAWLIHELVQPLNALGLISEQLKEKINGECTPSPEMQHLFCLLQQAIKQEAKALHSLRQLWQLNDQNIPLQLAPISVEKLLDLVQSSVTNSKINVTREVTGDLHIATYLPRCIDILSNLYQNALFHARSKVTFIVTEQDGEVRISITDDGEGLTEEMVVMLGQAFLRPKKNGSKQNGIGLGIHIAARCASLLRGHHIEFTTNNAGTCFSLIAPSVVSRIDKTGPDNSTSYIDPLANAQIFILDDQEEKETQNLGKLLASWGCTARFICPGTISRRSIQQTIPSVILANSDTWLIHRSRIRKQLRKLAPICSIIILGGEADMFDIDGQDGLHFNHLKGKLSASRLRATMTRTILDQIKLRKSLPIANSRSS